MAIDITGQKVKAKRIGDILKVKNNQRKFGSALEYNHLRVQFPDTVECHLLFTDSQIKLGIERANKNPEDLPNVSWLRDVLEDIVTKGRLADIQEVINQGKLPAAAKKYNHIRVEVDGQETHLLFTDNDIKVAHDRATKNTEDLPKVSWIKDLLD